jgi:uncharacterized repeat protein (TIGR02059 family)
MPDATQPTFVSAVTSSDGAQITLTYNESLNAITASTTEFTVRVDGLPAAVTQVSTSGADVRLGLAASILPGQSVVVSYTAPTNNAVATNAAIQDTAGNDAASLNAASVVNNSIVVDNTALNFAGSAIAVGTGYSLPEGIATADFNQDGYTDLVITDISTDGNPQIRVFLGNGSAGFTSGGTQLVGGNPTSLAAADFNGDGKVDLAVANYADRTISILHGDGSGNLAAGSTLTAGTPYAVVIGGNSYNTTNPHPRIIVSGDFNGDGKPDLAWTNDYDNVMGTQVAGTVGLAINNGTATPFSSVTVAGAIGNNPYGLIATDLNRDGNLDLIAANSPSTGNGNISVLLGNGNGTFQSATNTTVGTRPRYFAAGDFNRDGNQDLALTQTISDNNIRILLGNGSGGFSGQAILSLGVQAAPRGIIGADFNLDGYLDLAASSHTGDNVSIFLGSADGTFGTRKVFSGGDASYWLAIADFDSDGRPDLAITNQSTTSPAITLLLNRTTVTPADHTPDGVTVQGVDADGDGLREAVTDSTGRMIDGNRDGIVDAEQARVTGLRLINRGAFSTDYGAVSVSDGLILSDTHSIIPADNGRFAVITRNGDTVQAAVPYGVTNIFIGAVSFTVSGLDSGSTAIARIHMPGGLTENPNSYIRFNYLTNQFEDYTDAQGNPLYALIDSNNDGLIDAIELTLVDGDVRWDREAVTDGIVEDPGFAASAEKVFRGSKKSDELIGNVLANTLIGLGGNDTLIGDLGNDLLRGGSGRDLLFGGAGADVLIGGSGKDRYVYQQASDSSVDLPDRVRFDQNDRFDLSAMDANANLDGMQAFRFIKNAAFTGVAGELRATRYVLQADLNGDSIADFSVALLSGIRPRADQFIL